jgi:hypothetical protein
MYVKASAGGLLALTGAAAMPTVSPAFHVARLLLEITGAGFALYCVLMAGLFVAGCSLRRRARLRARRAASAL